MAGLYFFDDFALDTRVQLERTYVEPKRVTPEPYQGTGGFVGDPSIHWCPEIGCYRLWHSIISDTRAHHHVQGLAQSADCVTWQNTGHVYECQGRWHGAMVCRDEHETDPEKLYKAAGCTSPAGAAPNREDRGIVITSPDGMNWDTAGLSRCWARHRSDTNNCLLYNPVRDCYQVIHRGAFIDRRISSTCSEDLVEWSEPELLIHPDPLDPPCCQLYGMSAFHRDGVFIGFLLIYETDMLDPTGGTMGGRLITELVYSYDGLHWNRTHHRIIPYPQYPQFGAGCMAIQGLTEDKSGEKWMLAVSAPRLEHGTAFTKKGDIIHYDDPGFAERVAADGIDTRNHGILVYEIRRMGLVGLQGNLRSSGLRTKPIRLNKGPLRFNLSAPCGRVTFQISDRTSRPLPGFAFEDSIPFTGDALSHVPTWNGRCLEELEGQRIRIQMKLHMAIIYGITGDFNPYHGLNPQRSYGEPACLRENG